MPLGSPLLQRLSLRGRRVCPWEKLQATQLDLPLLQLRLFCDRASLWAKRRVKQPLKAMRRCQLPRPSSRFSYANGVSLALARVIGLD